MIAFATSGGTEIHLGPWTKGVSVDKNKNCDINTMAITGIPDTNRGLRYRYVVSHN